MKIIISNPSDVDIRLDKFLADNDKAHSRSFFSKLIENGRVFVNSKNEKSHYKLCLNDVIEYEDIVEEKFEIKPLEGELNIVYQDDDILVINKPQGLVVHPAPGHKDDTLVNILLANISNLSDLNGEFRPGIVHRIDKDTSGLLLIAKNNSAHAFLSNLLKEHEINREYYAIVDGVIKENDARIIAAIGRNKKYREKMCVDPENGKEAITNVHVIQRFRNATFISCKLETGRTHQIRVHLAYIGHPIIGDILYNNTKSNYEKQFLHAYRLTFIQPTTKKEIVVETPIPQYFLDFLDTIK